MAQRHSSRPAMALLIVLAACGKGPTGSDALPPGVVAGSPGQLALVLSDPADGSTVDRRHFSLEFSWTPDPAPPSKDLDFALLDARGRTCAVASSSVFSRAGATGPPYTVYLDLDGQEFLAAARCATPFDVTTLTATDRSTPPRQWRLPVHYRFDDPAVSPAATAPVVLSMRWDNPNPTSDECPLTDEPETVDCVARDDDGDSFTITISVENLGPGTFYDQSRATVSQTFPGARLLNETTHRLSTAVALRPPAGERYAFTRLQATCTVVDSRGLRAVFVSHCAP